MDYLNKLILAQDTNDDVHKNGVFVFIKLSDDDMGDGADDDEIYALEERLAEAIEKADAGEFDGDEWGGGYCQFFMYGKDADKLFAAIGPVLLANTNLPITHAVRRYGPLGGPEQVVRFSSNDVGQ